MQGGGRTASTAFATFLASIGTCAGIYVLGFCQQRGIPTQGIRIVQRMHGDQAMGLIGQIDLDIQLPPDFLEKYQAAAIRSAEQCAVKKHLEHLPAFNVTTSTVEAVAAWRQQSIRGHRGFANSMAFFYSPADRKQARAGLNGRIRRL